MPHTDLQLCAGSINSGCFLSCKEPKVVLACTKLSCLRVPVLPETSEGVDGQIFGMSVKTSDASGVVKCNRCGKKGHQVNQCTSDLSKVTCFKCGEMGHISLNCVKSKSGEVAQTSGNARSSNAKGTSAEKDSRGKASLSPKGKRKGRGGKKGKLFALFDEETGAWWYSDADESFEPEEGHSCAILCS